MSVAETWIARPAGAVGRGIDRLTAPRLSILIFHRVLRKPDTLFPEEIDAVRFDQLLRALKDAFVVLPLGTALILRDEGRLPPGALAITFDDGYADNADVALPLLQRHGLPATFFVATGFLDGGRMFNDTVIETMRATTRERIDLQAFGLGEMTARTAAERRAVIDAVLPMIKYSTLHERPRLLAALHRAAGSPPLPDDLMMSSEQVRQLHRAGMEMGGHTENHPILSLLDDADSAREIGDGCAALAAMIDHPVRLFAYPNGAPGRDYEPRHVDIVQRLGLYAAVSTQRGTVTQASDAFQLPRFTPWDAAPARWLARLLLERWRG